MLQNSHPCPLTRTHARNGSMDAYQRFHYVRDFSRTRTLTCSLTRTMHHGAMDVQLKCDLYFIIDIVTYIDNDSNIAVISNSLHRCRLLASCYWNGHVFRLLWAMSYLKPLIWLMKNNLYTNYIIMVYIWRVTWIKITHHITNSSSTVKMAISFEKYYLWCFPGFHLKWF